MYGWIKFLGWFNFSLLVLNSSLFITRWFYRKFNKKLQNFPWEGFKGLMKFLAKVHPFTGGILLVTALYRGYLATGGFVIYSGSLVFFGVLAQFIVYLLGKYAPAMKKSWRPVHRSLMLVTWALFFVHLFGPYSIWIPIF
ncbi:MAG: hypothetical protein KBI09_08845 [Mesotoga sp.]|nr:hypothetical protein [Mesotoga sp.]